MVFSLQMNPLLITMQRKSSNLEFFAAYYREMVEQGVFLPPSQFEGLFLSTAHSDADIEATIATEIAMSKLK